MSIRNLILAGTVIMCAVSVQVGFSDADEKRGPEDVQPVRIVCIGDSITQGRRGGGRHAMTFSYRYPLWKIMVDAEAGVEFVGSMRGGFNGDADWEPYLLCSSSRLKITYSFIRRIVPSFPKILRN